MRVEFYLWHGFGLIDVLGALRMVYMYWWGLYCRVLNVRANEQGNQITLNEPAPMLIELVDDYAKGVGYNLLEVWITWLTD